MQSQQHRLPFYQTLYLPSAAPLYGAEQGTTTSKFEGSSILRRILNARVRTTDTVQLCQPIEQPKNRLFLYRCRSNKAYNPVPLIIPGNRINFSSPIRSAFLQSCSITRSHTTRLLHMHFLGCYVYTGSDCIHIVPYVQPFNTRIKALSLLASYQTRFLTLLITAKSVSCGSMRELVGGFVFAWTTNVSIKIFHIDAKISVDHVGTTQYDCTMSEFVIKPPYPGPS